MIDGDRRSLRQPTLVLITDRRLAGGRSLVEIAAEAALSGVDLIQVREKDLPAAEQLRLALAIKAAVRPTARIVLNTSTEPALGQSLAGVHLPESGVGVAAARRLLPDCLIGASVHDINAAQQAFAAGADFVQFGTLFPSQSKPGRAAAGVANLAAVCAAVSGPVIAVGGVDATNAGLAIEAGAAGVAVISAIMAATEPGQAAQALRSSLDRAWRQRVDGVARPKVEATAMIELTINGKPRALDREQTLLEFLVENKIRPETVACEHNGVVVKRGTFAEARLQAGDRLEIVRMIGGGAVD